MAVLNPVCSTDNVWVGINQERSTTEELDDIKNSIANHTHSGYAASDHTHNEYADIDHQHTDYAPSTHTHTPSDIGASPATHSHAQSDVTGLQNTLESKADLVNGKVPESQLPSYVDDVLEYANLAAFPTTGESGKVYLDKDTNKAYRWGGTTYVEIAGGVALGETASTAYRGDHGKTAYDHSQDSAVHVTEAKKTEWDSKAAGNHTHGADAITAHLESVYYNAPVGGVWTNIPLTNWVSVGNGFTVVNNQIRVGAGISKVIIAAQICVGSENVTGNKYLSIRKNASQQKARTQIRLHEAYTPETMCIPPLLVDVAEGDLLTIDYTGTQGDTIYGELLFTYLTVHKIA